MVHRERPSGMRAVFVLAALLLLFISVYEFGRVLHLRPQPMHLWRQSDCLALTLNYSRGNGTFLQPEILSRIADKGTTGKSAGELPLIYFLMGKLWSVMGPSEFAYRLFGLLMHVAGTFALFGALRRVMHSDFWAVASALLFFTSPVVVYYCVAFLPDVPAFDLALIGWYALVRFAEERRHRYWYFAAACFGLATLLKVTAGMSLVALCALLVIATVRPRWLGPERKLLPDLVPAWGAVTAIVAAVLAWYMHAEAYNDAHGGRYTFNNLWPIWEMSPEKVEEAWHFAKDVLVFQVFDTSVWLLFGVAGVVLLVNARSVPRAVWLLNALLVIGAVAYCLLWFNALLFHDYYFINPQFALIVPWATFLWWMSRQRPDLLHARWARWAMSALVLFNLAYAANNMHMRYNESGPLMRSSLLPVYHELELPYWNTITYGPMRDLPTVTPFLRELGVSETDKVIFPDDGSINSALYLMGQPGFTRFGWNMDTASTYTYLIALGARYLVFSDPTWEERSWMRPYLRRPMGRHGGLQVFDLRGLERLRPERSTIDVKAAPAEGLRIRVDTVDSAGGSLHFGPGRVPLDVRGIMLDGPGTVSATLRVTGAVDRACGDRPGLNLVYEGVGDQGYKSYKAISLPQGRFVLDLLVPQPIKGPHRLAIENTTGAPFTVDSLVIEVERWVDPRPATPW
jgi:hypothetical protein